MVSYTQLVGPVPGTTMKVTFDGTFVDGAIEWKVDPKADKKDVTTSKTSNDAKWKAYLATLIDAGITLTLAYKNLGDPGQKKLWDDLALGSGVKEIRFYEDSTHYCFCDAFVEAFPLSAKIDDAQGAGSTVTLQILDKDGIQFPTTFD